MPLFIFQGKDRFSMQQEVQSLRKGVLESDIIFLDGKKVSIGDFEAAFLSLPFLSPRRVIILEGTLNALNSSSTRKKFSSLTQNLPPTTFIIILDEEGRFPSNLCPQAHVKRFTPPRGEKLRRWILSQVEKEGGNISSDAVDILCEFTPGDLGVLSSEIAKLSLYAQGRKIDKEDVIKLTSLSLKESIFSLVDSILEGHLGKALGALHYLLFSGATPPYILSMLCRQFRLLIQAKELMDQGSPAANMCDILGVQGYALNKILSQAENQSFLELTSAYGKLAEADLRIKTGGPPRLTLDILLAELMMRA
jgi:DNA polymerase-3 subunit delta